ncbi:MAG: anhydro-N-acetylmuramic acid kinase [Clostridiaceae bacterium]|nr:anhydro-N-acetylmuramic acid kinase [Clostridiaceae bacterium]
MTECIQAMLRRPFRLCVGVMSGTSVDGLDVAVCRIYGVGRQTELQLVHFETIDYTSCQREEILACCEEKTSSVKTICAVNKWLGVFIGHSVRQVCQNAGVSMGNLDFVASHGQTVHHLPDQGATLQIGEPADIAAITGCVTIADFRPSDMAYGGQGAPLVPFFDWLLYSHKKKNRILINAGGIANLTALPAGGGIEGLMAFDTGPANVLCDNLTRLYTSGAQNFDRDGALASAGTVSQEFLARMAAEDSFLPKPPPKSTGREAYTLEYAAGLLERGRQQGLSIADLMATAADYSAYCIQQAVTQFVPFAPDEVYLSGGGFHNLFFKDRLEQRLKHPVQGLSQLGIDGDAKEACLIAVLGNEFLHGRFNNAPAATGAGRNVIMGKLCFPSEI